MFRLLALLKIFTKPGHTSHTRSDMFFSMVLEGYGSRTDISGANGDPFHECLPFSAQA